MVATAPVCLDRRGVISRAVALAALAAAVAACANQRVPPPEPPPFAAAPVEVQPLADRESENLPGEEGYSVQGTTGTIEPEAVEEVFGRRRADLDACYTEGLKKHPWLGGSLELKLKVRRPGTVASAVVQRPLGNVGVERCVLAIVGTLSFPSPRGGPEAEVTYSLSFRGQMSLQEWGSGPVSAVFEAHRARLVRCARGGLPRALRIVFFVTPGGKAPSVGVGADEPFDQATAQCLADEVSRWKFPDPRGRVARTTYEF